MPTAFLRSILLRFVLLLCVCAATGIAHADDATDINQLFRSGQVAEAYAKIDQLLAAKPRDAQLRFLKGVMLNDTQRRPEAIAVFQQLTVDYPELPEPYNNLAVIYAAQGDYDQARAALEASLRASPNYAVAYQNLGDIYIQLARQSYDRALRAEPANPAIPPKLALLRQITTPIVNTSSTTPSTGSMQPSGTVQPSGGMQR